MITQERQLGDITEHMHDEYEYWHPITRVHKQEKLNNLPADHVLAPVVSEAQETPRGLQVQPFDWKTWDAGCHAKGICQGYTSIQLEECVYPELHHRSVAPELRGIAEPYWQCPHCKQLQKPIQWAAGARLEKYSIARRGHRTILWLQVKGGQWFVLVTKAYRSIQAVASSEGDCGTAYAVGNHPPQQMPDEIAVTLARRFWHRMTKGYWSDTPKEEEK